ncbi:MAG: HD domain-containing protein [bacterium]
MIHRNFALKIFKGFSVKRWNDLLRPVEFVEMDKVGEKMIIAYLIGTFEEKAGKDISWEKIIYAGFFELLRKIVLSDIKAPVLGMIKETAPDEYRKLNEWVVSCYEGIITDEELLDSFRKYVKTEDESGDLSDKIAKAAHKFSTLREFEILKSMNPSSSKIKQVEKELFRDVDKFMDLKAFQLLMLRHPPFEFLEITEEMRYQIRWGQSQRTPQTTVLGHSLFTACITLLLLRESPGPLSSARLFNGFFSALFHDLPEAVTRDIISPVKRATENLPEVVKKIENIFIQKELEPKMHPFFKKELFHFTTDEFENRILKNGKTEKVSYKKLREHYDSPEYSPIDGKLIEAADKISAFLEADRSINHGIISEDIKKGWDSIWTKFEKAEVVNGVDIKRFFREFDKR